MSDRKTKQCAQMQRLRGRVIDLIRQDEALAKIERDVKLRALDLISELYDDDSVEDKVEIVVNLGTEETVEDVTDNELAWDDVRRRVLELSTVLNREIDFMQQSLQHSQVSRQVDRHLKNMKEQVRLLCEVITQ